MEVWRVEMKNVLKLKFGEKMFLFVSGMFPTACSLWDLLYFGTVDRS